MQKISLYLYSNRVQVIADLINYPVEWRIVYQRTIKLYQGVDNTIEFDIKNAQQKRINLTDLLTSSDTLQMVILDESSQHIHTSDIYPLTNSIGLASTTIPASAFANMAPQLLQYSVYILHENGNKSPIYSDAQFGMAGRIDLVGGVLPTQLSPKVIDTFYRSADDPSLEYIEHYLSEAIEVNPRNDNNNHSIDLEFHLKQLNAEISIQVTDYAVISSGIEWTTLETFYVTETSAIVSKRFDEILDYSNNISWLRITYETLNDSVGHIDKVIVKV